MTPTTKAKSTDIQLSIILTVHAEGILLHKTLKSIDRALQPLHQKAITTELILHCDNLNAATEEYIETHKEQFKQARMFVNHFGDLGSSRNFAVKQAKGKYVTFIDADDFMSEEWLARAYEFLEAHEFGKYVAHSEYTVEFGGSDSLVIKHGEIDKPTDTLLSVFANRWNSIIMAPRELLLTIAYSPNKPGYGYEDWYVNCRLIYAGIHNVLIPGTVIFVRRKDTSSEWLRQKISYFVLPANPLLSFKNIRALPLPKTTASAAPIFKPSTFQKVKNRLLPAIKRVPGAEHYARKVYSRLHRVSEAASRPEIPAWLISEWRAMHRVEKQLFPSSELLQHLPIYDSLSPDHFKAGEAYKRLVDHTTKDNYDYVMFVPWLIHGGADLVTINYVNMLKKLRPSKNILVIATLPTRSVWADKLVDVDFMPFGEITEGLSPEIKFRLLEQLIENSGTQYVHITNSELGYRYVETYKDYLRHTDKKIILTSFSQSTDASGRVFGYSHTHVPRVYEQATAVTSDNAAVIRMWEAEYGFAPQRLFVIHQPVAVPELAIPDRPLANDSLKILWAARLSPEKQPQLVAQIGRLIQDTTVTIDMYGHIEPGFDVSFLNTLPSNVRYRGPFDGLYSLPIDQYDAYLYTSLFDGMPNSVLEAIAGHLPIVSSNVGGLPDLITTNQDGILVDDLQNPKPYAAALRKLAEEPELLLTYCEKLFKKFMTQHSPAAYEKEIKAFLAYINY